MMQRALADDDLDKCQIARHNRRYAVPIKLATYG